MGLLQGLTNRIRNTLGRVKDTTIEVGRGLTEAAATVWYGKEYAVSYSRTQTHKDMTRMDTDDEIVKFALNAIASRALGYEDMSVDAFTLNVQKRSDEDADDGAVKKAQRIIEDLIERCRLREEAWQIIRRFVKYGNEFREILYDGAYSQVVGLKALPEHTIWPKMDKMGNRIPGYTQRPENSPAEMKEIPFSEYEILHFTFGELDGYVGTPLLNAAMKNWKRLNLALDFTAVARLIRAFMKIVHKVPVSSNWSAQQVQQAIKIYQENMTQRKIWDPDTGSGILDIERWPTTVFTDFFIPDDGSKRGGVEMLDPENAQLQNIEDIKHFTDRLICGTHVPKRYFPFEGGTPKLSEGGGNAEDKHFACLLQMCQMVLKQGYTTLFNYELALNGIDYTKFRYVFKMARINTIDTFRIAQTDLNKAKTFELLVNKIPGLAEVADVWLREYTSMSDASVELLKAHGLEPAKPEAPEDPENPGGNGTGRRTRIQLPSAGTGEESRTQI